MTLFEPTLQLVWLKVQRNKSLAYSARFHEGVNIVSGQNASGKSTVMDFIFYVLGGENAPWKNEALLCDEVLAEVLLNGTSLTLRRHINQNSRNPIFIYWGAIEDAELAAASAWETYPFQRSANKESFSQVLFRLMKLPELRGAGAANITMHQILRLLYVDQRTPHDQIFRAESFDSVLTRETVGEYLCGVHSSVLYEAQLELRNVEAQLSKLVSDLRSLFLILNKSGQVGSTRDFLNAEEASIKKEIGSVENRLIKLRQSREVGEGVVGETTVEMMRAKLSSAQLELVRSQQAIVELQFDIEDSKMFISEVERRADALDDSESARTYLGSMKFQFCPCCLATIEDDAEHSTACNLCKNPFETSIAGSQILRMKNELALQRRESVGLLEEKIERLNKHLSEAPILKNKLRQLEQEYSQMTNSWSSTVELEIEALSRTMGELNQKLDELGRSHQLATVIEEMQSKRDEFEVEKLRLQDVILSAENKDEKLKKDAKLLIASSLIELLKLDLPRQEEFQAATEVDWNFARDCIFVNGHTQFSESSMVILKQSFHMALLMASALNGDIRIPRFILLDGIEDGGQEIERSHKLQENIVAISSKLEVSHQIIFATSQIAPALAHEQYVVGTVSTMTNKTLAIL